MTRNESFKKRVRARMATTGERYGAARRILLEQAARRQSAEAAGGRAWAATPEVSDEAVRSATGRGWDEWVDVVEADPVAEEGHAAVAAWVGEVHGVDGWWAQAVTGGWERITGRRLPGEMPDGTFTVNRSRTLSADADVDRATLRALLLDDDERAALFPSMESRLRSSATAKTLRIGLPDGVAQVAVEERPDGRVRVAVQHQGLPSPDDVDPWRTFWSDWLAALDT